jgi:hypothetical protein
MTNNFQKKINRDRGRLCRACIESFPENIDDVQPVILSGPGTRRYLLCDREKRAGKGSPSLSLFKIEDGWMGYKLVNNYVAIVFECPDHKSARVIIQKNEANLGGNRER